MSKTATWALDARVLLAMARVLRHAWPGEAKSMARQAFQTAAKAALVAYNREQTEVPHMIACEPILLAGWNTSQALQKEIRRLELVREQILASLPSPVLLQRELMQGHCVIVREHFLDLDVEGNRIIGTNPYGQDFIGQEPTLPAIKLLLAELAAGTCFGKTPPGDDGRSSLQIGYDAERTLLTGSPAVHFDDAYQVVVSAPPCSPCRETTDSACWDVARGRPCGVPNTTVADVRNWS